MENTVKSITTVSKPFPDGQRVTALAIEYDRPVNASAVSADCFDVEGRTVTGVCVSDRADGEAAQTGSFVVIALDPKDENATTITNPDGSRGRRRPPRPENGREPARPPMEPIVFPDGRIFKGPHGIAKKRAPLAQQVRQTADITAADGSVISAWTEQLTSDKEINEWADLFVQRRYEDMDYNLYIPEDYDPSKKYPLVLFMPDATVTGKETTRTLTQGIGATIWASPAEQAKHPSFVLAPDYTQQIINDNWETNEYLDATVNLIHKLCGEYSIDTDRMYTTGQSGGCMLSFAIDHYYPDLFAASLLMAGKWDNKRVSNFVNDKMWMLCGEGDLGALPSMTGICAELRKLGVKVSEAQWNGRVSAEEFDRLCKEMDAEGADIRFTHFIQYSVFPDDTHLDGMEHLQTWRLTYAIEGVRDWLFRQSK